MYELLIGTNPTVNGRRPKEIRGKSGSEVLGDLHGEPATLKQTARVGFPLFSRKNMAGKESLSRIRGRSTTRGKGLNCLCVDDASLEG